MSKGYTLKKREIINTLVKKQGLICGICGFSIEAEYNQYSIWAFMTFNGIKGNRPKRTSINLDLDHKIPKSVEKPWLRNESIWANIENLQLSHKSCNNKKGNSL